MNCPRNRADGLDWGWGQQVGAVGRDLAANAQCQAVTVALTKPGQSTLGRKGKNRCEPVTNQIKLGAGVIDEIAGCQTSVTGQITRGCGHSDTESGFQVGPPKLAAEKNLVVDVSEALALSLREQ